ncbi:MAG: PQQ-binding-like beta-propeller repeat protein, partial [Gemmataceae bacterium]
MKTRWLLAAMLMIPTTLVVHGADWPQWRGPERTDVSQETGLLAKWPQGGPKLLWTCEDAGIGFSGFAVVGDRLYTLGSDGKSEYVIAVDVNTGKRVWATPIGAHYTNGWGDGPRGTPTVDGDAIYAISAAGNLACVDAKTGKGRWSNSFTKAGGRTPNWGYTESPLIDGDKVVCTPGSKIGTFAAFDKKTGKPLWYSKGLTDGAAYSSIITADVGGVKQYINMTSQGVAAVTADDGRPLWKSGEGRNGTAIIPTPIFHDNHVFITSGYG